MSDLQQDTPAPTRKTRKTMSPSQQLEAISLYQLGEETVRQLSKRYEVGEDALRKLFARRGVKSGEKKEEMEAKRQAALEAALTIDPIVHARRVFDTKNETYRITEMLRKLVAAEIVKARQEGRPLGTIQQDMKTIREAAMVIKICREEAYNVLGIKPEDAGDDFLPELKVAGLTDAQISELEDQSIEQGIDAISSEDVLPPEPAP